jgi:hypothetical protein
MKRKVYFVSSPQMSFDARPRSQARRLNLHTGMSPHCRDVDWEFWPVPEEVGAKVRLTSEKCGFLLETPPRQAFGLVGA